MNKSNQHLFSRCMYFNSNALTRKLNSRWDQAFAKFDLSPALGYLLRLVLASPGLSQQQIAGELNLEKSTVTRFLVRMENKQLIRRVESKTDPRQNIVYPTNIALDMQKDLETLGNDLYTSMCEKIGEKNVENFVASLKEITNKL